jgi:drug/metabolite transporter (DMT)-like permease
MKSKSMNPYSKSAFIGFILVIISAVCFATLGIFASLLRKQGFSTESILTWRFVGAGILLWAILFIKKDYKLSLREGFISFSLGLAGYALASYLFIYAILKVGLALGTVLLYTYTAFSCFFRWLFFKHKLSKNDMTNVALSFVGCILVCGIYSFSSATGKLNLGHLSGLMAGLIYALYLVLNEKYLKNTCTLKSTAWMTLGTGFIFIVLTFLGNQQLNLVPPNFEKSIFPLFGIMFFSTLLPLITLLEAIKLIGPVKSAVISTLEPCIAAVFGLLIFHQHLENIQIWGIILVIVSVLSAQKLLNLNFIRRLNFFKN